MIRSLPGYIAAFVLLLGANLWAQAPTPEQIQVSPPPRQRTEPPSPAASAKELETRGDQLRAEKNYIDALDYYQSALAKMSNTAPLFNKAGITNLMLQRLKEAKKNFERAIKIDHKLADAYNNLGVIYYLDKNYGKAIKQYEKAIRLSPDTASYYSNMGASYFARKDFEKAAIAYQQALQYDPDVLERTSRSGVTAQLPSPQDRARYDYVMAKLYAKMGSTERCLDHLRRAIEEGYKDIENVYKDAEFADLRNDPRFTQLMTDRPTAITQ